MGTLPITMKHIESVSVRYASLMTGDEIQIQQLYKGVTKVRASVSLARRMAFLFMHDQYGISYSNIAKWSGFTQNAVIHAVMKARVLRFIDRLYMTTYNLINKNL